MIRMTMRRSALLVATAAMLAVLGVRPTTCSAQANGGGAHPSPLRGRHAVSLHAGLLARTDAGIAVGVGTVASEASTTGFLGALSWEYGAGPTWSIGITVGVIAATAFTDAVPGGVDARAATVSATLVGAAWYPEALALGAAVRPYASLGIGPYHRHVGATSASGTTFVAQYRTARAAGMRLTGGADWYLGDHMRVGVAAGYHLVADFARMEGGMRNASGPEVSLRFGVLLGALRR